MSDTTPPSRRLATAELLAVGAELLVGETRDTNSGDLAVELTALGVDVRRMSQLPDDLDVVTSAIEAALRRVDLVVTTGGLGPTPDDLTRESIAAALDREPFVDAELERWLRDIWERRGLAFTNNNLKQAWLLPDSEALPNPYGTAPGWWVEVGDQVVIALPGPPRELAPMWQQQALPRLHGRGIGLDRAAETLRLTGIGESVLADLLGEALLTTDNPRVATYARPDSVDVRISATADPPRTAAAIVDAAVERLLPQLEPYVYARDDEGWLEALTGRLEGRQLVTIEVGTAGHLANLLGTAPWLLHSEQVGVAASGDAHPDVQALAHETAARLGSKAALAVAAFERDDDMQVEICVFIDGRLSRRSQSVFRGGDAGRRRAANAAAAELWRRLSDQAPMP